MHKMCCLTPYQPSSPPLQVPILSDISTQFYCVVLFSLQYIEQNDQYAERLKKLTEKAETEEARADESERSLKSLQLQLTHLESK